MTRYYITTAIDYVNSRPHLGTAYEKITADIIARYRRLAGFETHFLMGNDEHSQNVFKKAKELGLDPVAYCDRMEQEFRGTWDRLDVSYDDFIRTTEPRHKERVAPYLTSPLPHLRRSASSRPGCAGSIAHAGASATRRFRNRSCNRRLVWTDTERDHAVC